MKWGTRVDVPAWVRYAVFIVGSLLAAICGWFVARSVRRLNKGIEEFEAELEARQGAPLDPYSSLAQIYAEQRQPKRSPRRKNGPPA